jgi:MSHA biogenesis protein MshP
MRSANKAHAQRGMSALLVIAVLVLLGSVTAYAVRLVTTAHAGVARETAYTRAVAAARAGLDWGRYRLQVPPAAQCTPTQSIATLPGTLAPYTVTVRCSAGAPRQESGATVRAYRLSATACNLPAGGQCPNAAAGPDYVEHSLSLGVVR